MLIILYSTGKTNKAFTDSLFTVFDNLQAPNTSVMENPSIQFIENVQSSNIGPKTSSLENKFQAEIILSSLPSEHSDEDDDKLLIVDEELSDSEEELMKKNIAEY